MNLTVSLPGKTGQSSTVENYKLRKCAVAAYFPTLDGLIASDRLLTIEGPVSMKLISQLYLLEGSEVFTGLTWNKWAAWKNESHSQADPGKLGIAHGIQSTTDIFSCSELLKGTRTLFVELSCEIGLDSPNCRLEYPIADTSLGFGELSFYLFLYFSAISDNNTWYKGVKLFIYDL